MAKALSNKLFFIFSAIHVLGSAVLLPVAVVEGAWCVARSDASSQALQTALDYACGSGADCSPILSDGLCFLPNTIQGHASYAFNSYFQRKGMAAGSCDFSGTASIAKTDPSYGSCVYPSSLRQNVSCKAASLVNLFLGNKLIACHVRNCSLVLDLVTDSAAGGTGTTPTSTNPNIQTPMTGDGTTGLNPGTPPCRTIPKLL
ncbi:unnamed protein product [Dovyalis caffra]|uniref:X8 domain-containing protein n=1 Tax=Dovyalis caffra TaxID=77055 RepID=A0AAV1R4W4_9ROSI|nr:unnamed protein product [Dovyalis caffra]